MSLTTLHLAIANAVARITLDRPPVNAINLVLLNELETTLQQLEADADVRAIIITGAGERTFSAGADFAEFADQSVRAFLQKGVAVFNRIERLRKPVIAAVNGGAFGGGFELAMCCHLRFIADVAQFALTEVKLGIMSGWGGTQRLPRLIGRTRALEFLLTGDRIDAQAALNFGLVNRVCPQAELLPTAQAFAERLAKGAPLAQAAILEVVQHGLETTVEEGLKLESARALALGETEDAMIGVMSMVQKQQPQFKGR